MVIGQHFSAPTPSIGSYRPELAGLDRVFAAAMAKEPSSRFGSCAEFADQLARHVSGASTYTQDTQRVFGVPAQALPSWKRWARRPRVLIPALMGVALLVVAGGVFAGGKLTRHRHSAAPAGSLTGIYRTDFGPITGLDDVPDPAATPALTDTYGLRSVCGSAGCVATASRLSGAPVAPPTMVFDKVGGRWVAVVLGSDQCRNAPAEFWQVFTLQPHPDGTLTGEYTATAGNACADKRAVTFTRTGDVDVNSVPDPASQPSRVVSRAEALHGRYRVTRTFASGIPQLQSDAVVTTDCLRTGDRCMSYFHGPSGDVPLVFGSGNWILNVEDDGKCPASEEITHVKTTGQYSLPQPSQNPIALLTGHGHQQQTGSCPVNTDFDDKFTRTGD